MNKKNSKIKKIFLPSDSKEYQRMLAGFRIYFSLMTQRTFINFIIFILFLMAFIYTFFGLIIYYNQSSMTFSPFIMPLTFFFIPIMIFVLIMQYKEFNFKLLKGYLIFLRNPSSLILLILSLAMLIFITTFERTIESIAIILGYFVYLQLFVVLIQMHSYLEPTSLLSYAKEKLDDTINIMTEKNIRILTSKFELFYYSIYTYYKLLIREIKARYKDDTLLYFQFDKIPFLASQIHTKDPGKRMKLKSILTNLEQTIPMEKPDEYIKIMEDIDKSYRESLNLPNDVGIIRRLFRERTSLEKIKLYLIPLIPLISIALNIYFNYLK